MPTPAPRTPVLVAGAGVAGSLTALELARHGVPSIVVERAGDRSRRSGQLLIGGRSMGLLRRLGLAEGLRADGVDPACAVDTVWSQEIDRPPVLVCRLPSVVELRRTYAANADVSEPYLLISGPGLTGRLRRALREHPLIDLRTRWTLTDVRVEPDGVVATVLAAEASTRRVIAADYLAAGDGADSTVRRCVGLAMEPLGPPAPHVTVYFRSPALAGRWDRPSAVITGGATVVTGHDGDTCVAHLPVGPDDQAAVPDPADLLRHRLGPAGDAAQLLAVVQGAGTPSVARSYRRGRVFLVGQAAHQAEPPGDDVDTCIGDAVDLGRRLAAAVHGRADAQLLAGYQTVRRRQALLDRELARRALQTRGRFQRLVAAGATREVLADVLRQEAPSLDPAGGTRRQIYENT